MMIMNISFTLMKNDEEYNKKRNPKYTHTYIYICIGSICIEGITMQSELYCFFRSVLDTIYYICTLW